MSTALQTVAALGERPEATVADLEAALDQAEAEQRRNKAAEVSGVAAQMLKQRVRRRGTPTGAEA